MRRARLEGALDLVLDRRLGCLVAGAGFGKTTLLSMWAQACPARQVWYPLGARDEDMATLATGLTGSLAAAVPAFPRTVAAAVFGGRGPGGADRVQADVVSGVLCDALRDCLREDVVLVLDDAEALPPDGPAARLIEGICRQAPATVHLVMASRSEPPFRTERLRAYGDMVELTATDLAFTAGETAEFLDASAGTAGDLAGEVHAATGGWPVAVRLAAEALARSSPEDGRRILDGIRDPRGTLFDYLAHEVFDREPAGIRDLVRVSAHFGRVSDGLLRALGHDDATRAITSLTRRGLFVQAGPPRSAEFTLIPLARQFALRSRPLPPDDLREAHRRAADWFERSGDVESAIESLAAIGEASRSAGLLVEHGGALLAAGRGDTVLRAARTLGPDHEDAAVCRLVGEALQVRGEWDTALSYLTRAARGEDPPRAGTAWRLGLIHYLRGEPEQALGVFGNARTGADETREDALLAAWTACAHWALGHVAPSRARAAEALELAASCGDPRALALAHTARSMVCVMEGDPEGNAFHYAEAVRYAELAGDLVQLARIRTNRAAHHIGQAEFDLALGELSRAIPLAELSGFAMFHALGLHNRGETYRYLGRLDEAIVDLGVARDLYRQMGSHHVCRPLRALGDVYRERGDQALARAAYEDAITHARACGEVRALVRCHAGLARTLAGEDPGRAMELAERALHDAVGADRRTALLAVGWVALGRGELLRAMRMAAAAAGEARRQRDWADLADSLHLRALAGPGGEAAERLLHEVVALCRDIGSPLGQARAELEVARLTGDRESAERALRAAQRIGAHGTAVAATAVLAAFDEIAPPPVAIRTLGGFAVLHDGEPVPLTAWQSKKARDLLKILVTRRGRPVPRTAMMDALWPGEDPARVANRLSVALSTARTVLDPGRRCGPDHLIVAEADAVRLDTKRLAVDVEDFLSDATAGLALRRDGRGAEAGDRLARAQATYRGDFLEADPYDDWAGPLREEARAVYIQVSRALAGDASHAGDHDGAGRHLMRILERDPYDEPAHLALVGALVATRSHGEARRRYRQYVARMTEIDVEAAPFPHAPQTGGDRPPGPVTPGLATGRAGR